MSANPASATAVLDAAGGAAPEQGGAPSGGADPRRAAFDAALKGQPVQAPRAEPEEPAEGEQDGENDLIAEGELGPEQAPAKAAAPKAEPKGVVHVGKTPAEREKIALAKLALARDLGQELADKALKYIPTAELLEIGERRRQEQAQIDAYRASTAKAASAIRESRAAQNDPNAEPEGEPKADAADPLDALLDEMEGKTPAKPGPKAAPQGSPEVEAQLAEARTTLFQTYATYAIRDLSQDFPELAEEAGLRQVLETMKRLDPEERMLLDEPGLRNLMREASWIVFGEARATRESSKAAKAERAKRTRTELSDEPDAGSGGEAPGKPPTSEQRRKAAFDKAMEVAGRR